MVDKNVLISKVILPPAQPIIDGETRIDSITRLKGMAESPVTSKSLGYLSLLPVATSTPIKMPSRPIPFARRTLGVIVERENPRTRSQVVPFCLGNLSRSIHHARLRALRCECSQRPSPPELSTSPHLPSIPKSPIGPTSEILRDEHSQVPTFVGCQNNNSVTPLSPDPGTPSFPSKPSLFRFAIPINSVKSVFPNRLTQSKGSSSTQTLQVLSEANVETVEKVADTDKVDVVPSALDGDTEITGELAGGSTSQLGPSDTTGKRGKEDISLVEKVFRSGCLGRNDNRGAGIPPSVVTNVRICIGDVLHDYPGLPVPLAGYIGTLWKFEALRDLCQRASRWARDQDPPLELRGPRSGVCGGQRPHWGRTSIEP